VRAVRLTPDFWPRGSSLQLTQVAPSGVGSNAAPHFLSNRIAEVPILDRMGRATIVRFLMSPARNPQPCTAKEKLVAALGAAHHTIVMLGDQEVGAVIRGDMEAAGRLEGPLREARTARNEAMRALRDHIAEHSC